MYHVYQASDVRLEAPAQYAGASEGFTRANLDGKAHGRRPGGFDLCALAHSWGNPDGRAAPGLETQAPQLPSKYSYRYNRDWNHLEDRLAEGEA